MFSKETRTNTHNLQLQKLFILMVEGGGGFYPIVYWETGTQNMQYTLNCLTDTKTCIVYNILSYEKKPHMKYTTYCFLGKNQTITCNIHSTVKLEKYANKCNVQSNNHMQCTIYCFIERNSNKYVPNKLYCLTKGGDEGNKHMLCIQFCLIL